jgi:hypothetical protein
MRASAAGAWRWRTMQLLQEVSVGDGSPTRLLQGRLLLRLRVCVTAVRCRRSAEVRRRGSAAGACGGGLAGERDWRPGGRARLGGREAAADKGAIEGGGCAWWSV